MTEHLSGEDIREGVRMAREDMDSVRAELKTMAEESRFKGISGSDREEFLRGMTQEEFNVLHRISVEMETGDGMAMNALERILKETMGLEETE